MSGSKVVTTVTLFDLIIPYAPFLAYYTGKAAYYTGKAIVEATETAGQLTAEGIERFQEYQRKQAELRQQKLEKARREAFGQLQENISKTLWLYQQNVTNPFMNDNATVQAVNRVQAISSLCNPDLELEKSLELNLELEKITSSLKARATLAQRYQRERENLLEQLDQTRLAIAAQKDVPAAPELAALEDYRRRINEATVDNFMTIQAEYSNWAAKLFNKIKSVQTDVKVKSLVCSLWNSLSVSPELAQQYDSAGYSELKRIESFILSSSTQSSAKDAELVRFQNTFAKHKAAVEIKKRQEDEREAERAEFRKTFEPKLDEMAMRLALTDKEIVNRWEKTRLSHLTRQLAEFSDNLAKGNVQSMQADIDSWNESFDAMLTEAARKQQAEERRQYIIEAMKLELPKLGFDIQSLASQADAASNTVIKVVPQTQKAGKRQRITITVPQGSNEPVNYKFDGYDLKHNRIEGRPVVENDSGKQTVMDIAAALKPYGISMSEPDWSGNPNRIQKNADSLPDDGNPAEELEMSQSEAKQRSIELD